MFILWPLAIYRSVLNGNGNGMHKQVDFAQDEQQ